MNKIERDRIAQGFEICTYMITKKCTLRKVSEKFGLSPTTARNRMNLVKEQDIELYNEAKRIQAETVLKLQYESCRKGNATRDKKADERHKVEPTTIIQEEKLEECGVNRRIAILRKKLKPGDTVTVFKKDKDEELDSNKKLKNVEVKAKVLGVYSHTVLLNIKGIRESFTYDEINRLIKA